MAPIINLFMRGVLKMSTMKEVYEKMKAFAERALSLLEPVYELYTKSGVAWAIGSIEAEDVENGIVSEIRIRKEQLSKEYEEILLEFEKEINDQFKDVCNSVKYNVDHERDRIDLFWVRIAINDFETSIAYSKEYGLDVSDGCFPPYNKIRGLNIENAMEEGGVPAAVETLRKIYDIYVSENE
jgi:hypothetical protein